MRDEVGREVLRIAQMLARVNEGRRRRGEPELTVAEYRAKLEADAAD